VYHVVRQQCTYPTATTTLSRIAAVHSWPLVPVHSVVAARGLKCVSLEVAEEIFAATAGLTCVADVVGRSAAKEDAKRGSSCGDT
jgi:hypothetical protein